MKDVTENKLFYRTIQVLYILLLICAMEIFIPLNDVLQLSTLPNTTVHDISNNLQFTHSKRSFSVLDTLIQQLTFPGFITVLMLLDTIVSYTFERTIRRIYSKTTAIPM
jgi:hypothetical protein